LSVGIVGLPNVGIHHLQRVDRCDAERELSFLHHRAERRHRAGRRSRLVEIAGLAESKVLFTDLGSSIAGLVRRERRRGLASVLANIRETDAILHVVRCFDDPNVVHVGAASTPKRDIEVIETSSCSRTSTR
jgi:ribosome-binding ATPase YchF (GTP1/OBG family)